MNAEKINPLIDADNINGTAANCAMAIGTLSSLLGTSSDCLTSDKDQTGIWLLLDTIAAALRYHEKPEGGGDE